MKLKLSTIDNGLGLLIEKPILELLKIDRNTELEATIDGGRIIIEPIHVERTKRIANSASKIMKDYDGIFRNLAK